MINRKIFCGALTIVPTLLCAAESERLNVIVILTDDVGYGDVSYTGNPYIQTPAMQELYSESICFDNFHTGTTSAPTRSGLMTGVDGNRTGVWHTIAGRSLLDLDLYTLGDLFKDNGYATAMYGKWHLGDNYPYRPCDRGFDDVLCLKGGGIGQLPDYWGNTYFDDTYYRDRDIPEPQTGYCTDIFTNEAIRFATENSDNPFFVYLAYNSAHAPFNVEASYSDPYKEMDGVGNPMICGMITNIDDNIARLRASLKEQGLDKNTVIVLFGDNGPNNVKLLKESFADTTYSYNGGLRGKKSMAWEGGHRQAMLMHIPGEGEVRIDNELAMVYDILPTLANLCGIEPKCDREFDGVDILSSQSRAGRIGVVDTQRQELLREGATSAVLMDDWRLIDRKKLYNIAKDREQRVDVAKSHPDIVEKLAAEYDQWWSYVSEDEDVRHPIYLATDVKGESVLFTSHDLHTMNGKMPVWNQGSARRNVNTDGFWSVYAPKSGKYDFELYRWSPFTGLNLDQEAPKGRSIPNSTKVAPKGVAITNMKSATIYIDGVEVASVSDFPTDQQSVSLPNIKLSEGYHELRAEITNTEGKSYPVWFVRCTK